MRVHDVQYIKFDYDKVPRGHYEHIIWEGHPIRRFWHQWRFIEMSYLVRTDEKSAIMDYGCASGSFLGTLRKPYAEAVGVDIAKTQVDLANQKYGNERLCFMTVEESAKLPKNHFDYIINSEVIEHVAPKEAEKLLRQFADWLKPDGRLILSTPNYHSLWPLIEFFVNRLSEVDYDHQHINKLHTKSCRELLDRCGFRLEYETTMFVASPFLVGISENLAKKTANFEKRFLPHSGAILLVSAVKK